MALHLKSLAHLFSSSSSSSALPFPQPCLERVSVITCTAVVPEYYNLKYRQWLCLGFYSFETMTYLWAIFSGIPLFIIPTKAQLRWGDTELVYAALWFSRFQDFVTKLFAECLKYLLRQAVVWLYWADTRGTTLFSIDRLNVAQRAGENHLHIDISVFTKPPASNSLMRILWTEFFTCRFYL